MIRISATQLRGMAEGCDARFVEEVCRRFAARYPDFQLGVEGWRNAVCRELDAALRMGLRTEEDCAEYIELGLSTTAAPHEVVHPDWFVRICALEDDPQEKLRALSRLASHPFVGRAKCR